MDELRHTLGAMPAGTFRRLQGKAYWDGRKWWANVNGMLVDCDWADPLQPAQNSPIIVDVTSEGGGLASAFVSAMYSGQPRPSTGTVSALGVSDMVVLGEDGGGYATDRIQGPQSDYHVGDAVRLMWSQGVPTVMEVIAAVQAPAQQDPPAQATGPGTGYEVLTATASDTWGVGGWGRWATSQRGGEDVYTGTYGGTTVTGAWFYGAPRPALQGKTITKILFRVPARILEAGTRADVTVTFYAHTDQARPGRDVNRVGAGRTITIPAGYQPWMTLEAGAPPGYIFLPLDYAPYLQAGGGVCIAGGPYAGFNSRLDDPESGKTIMDWKA